MAKACKYQFISISAVTSGVKEIREAVKEAENDLKFHHKKTVFIDEIHRFHKGQQSLLLPHVEEGIVTLIGSTTENPSFLKLLLLGTFSGNSFKRFGRRSSSLVEEYLRRRTRIKR